MPLEEYYKVSSADMVDVADTIRTKGGTQAALTWPAGWKSAVSAISGGENPNTDFVKSEKNIPNMTSATVPSGTVSRSSAFTSSYEAYMAFNENTLSNEMLQNSWLPANSDSAPWISYEFQSPAVCGILSLVTSSNAGVFTRNMSVEGQKTDDSWENILASGNSVEISFQNGTYGENAKRFYVRLNNGTYSAIKLSFDDNLYRSGIAGSLNRIQVLTPPQGALPGLGYYGIDFPSSAQNGNIFMNIYTNTLYQLQNGVWVKI